MAAPNRAATNRRYPEGKSDDCLFCLSLVPLLLVLETAEKSIIWKNPRPSSTRYCRPIELTFTKETPAVIKEEVERVQNEVNNLAETIVELNNGQKAVVKHELFLTMVDGKVCNALSCYDSSQRCYICGAWPKEMNDHTLPVRQENPSTLGFGISPLHAWIRCMECILHITCRNDVKKWAIRSVEDKKKVEERKRKIQKEFREEIGLRIDIPRKTSGNSNDGNTARRFFRDASASARITGIDETLIHSFGVILEALSCGYSISKVAFGEYAKRTRERYLELYPWLFMPVTVHDILVHGVSIIESCVLPIGQLSEKAQEARNKENRDFREYYSRKNSRQNAN